VDTIHALTINTTPAQWKEIRQLYS
jgi:acid stress-induced BolA-like protein IbaG/YrbA